MYRHILYSFAVNKQTEVTNLVFEHLLLDIAQCYYSDLYMYNFHEYSWHYKLGLTLVIIKPQQQ